jgi:hypothetical protein
MFSQKIAANPEMFGQSAFGSIKVETKMSSLGPSELALF